MACGDREQALVWLLRTDHIGADGMLRKDAEPVRVGVELPCLRPGTYRITAWDTALGEAASELIIENPSDSGLRFETPAFVTDMAFAVRHLG